MIICTYKDCYWGQPNTQYLYTILNTILACVLYLRRKSARQVYLSVLALGYT